MVLTLRYVLYGSQKKNFALHSISRLVLYNLGGECLLRGTD